MKGEKEVKQIGYNYYKTDIGGPLADLLNMLY